MSVYPYRPLETGSLRTRSIKGRPSKVDLSAFARPYRKGEGLQGWMRSLPGILAGTDFREAVESLERARRKERAMVWGLGGHVVKCGLNAVIIDLMERGYVSALALNGATAIHDFEIALVGATSEEVEKDLAEGDFGVSEETGREMNAAVDRGVREGKGIGQALGEWILERPGDYPHTDYSLLANALRRRVPVTVHVALGTDTTHYHPSADGEALGRGTLQDFRLLASIVRDLHASRELAVQGVAEFVVALETQRGADQEAIADVGLEVDVTGHGAHAVLARVARLEAGEAVGTDPEPLGG